MRLSRKKRRLKKFTLMLIPHAMGDTRQWRIANWVVSFSILAMISIVVTGAYFGYALWHSFEYRLQQDNLVDQLRQTNSIQNEELQTIRTTLATVYATVFDQLQDVASLETQLRSMVGLPTEPQGQPMNIGGQGGGESPIFRLASRGTLGTSSNLTRQIDSSRQSLEALQQQISTHLDQLQAIPSLWPLPVEGRLTSLFGLRKSPFSKRREFHGGIDIAAPTGTVVKAAGKGNVIIAGVTPTYGRTVVIDHGNGWKSIYGHNSSLLVKKGNSVEQGTPIARVGSSGRSTGPHLHFTLEQNGVPVDPMEVLGKYYIPERTEQNVQERR